MMSLDVDALSAQLREIYPGRDWRNKCQQLVWNVVWLTGTPESDIHTYPSAADAYAASEIVSMDPDAAPEGASHYFQNPWPDKHVAVALGAGAAFMASNFVGGDGLGVVGVRDYIARAGNPYLGWSYNNGVNRVTVTPPDPEPVPAPDLYRTENTIMATTIAEVIGTPRADGGQDYYLVDHLEHVAHHIPTSTQLGYYRDRGWDIVAGQAPAILANYRIVLGGRDVQLVDVVNIASPTVK